MTNIEDIKTENTSFEDVLAHDGFILWRTKGTSMEPLIKEGRDLVGIHAIAIAPKPYDVVLYRRGSSYILHRIIAGPEQGIYEIIGDNCIQIEKIPQKDVIGIMTSLNRKGRDVNLKGIPYRLYTFICVRIYPARKFVFHIKNKINKVDRSE